MISRVKTCFYNHFWTLRIFPVSKYQLDLLSDFAVLPTSLTNLEVQLPPVLQGHLNVDSCYVYFTTIWHAFLNNNNNIAHTS